MRETISNEPSFVPVLMVMDGRRRTADYRTGETIVFASESRDGASSAVERLDDLPETLVRATPDGYKEVGRVANALPGTKNWNHLTFARDCVFLRNHFEMVCYGDLTDSW